MTLRAENGRKGTICSASCGLARQAADTFVRSPATTKEVPGAALLDVKETDLATRLNRH
jgi:hypothetical protein